MQNPLVGSTNTFSQADQDAIFAAYRDSVRIQQTLYNILTGKAGLFQVVPLIGEPVSAALRSVKSSLDTFTPLLINTSPARAADLTLQKNNLDGTLNLTITAYDGLSVSANGNTVQPGGRRLQSASA